MLVGKIIAGLIAPALVIVLFIFIRVLKAMMVVIWGSYAEASGFFFSSFIVIISIMSLVGEAFFIVRFVESEGFGVFKMD